ncbi:response regulator transcription factor [Tenacibaculum aiptasiae]|uniref:response regulator transcription factor n=2 Tax=Tenacibaculum aiptasiae TaxID=426481 RepID=UPI00232C9594|nr:response regulator transcription factor [Tenacibaculum aiptasiae]
MDLKLVSKRKLESKMKNVVIIEDNESLLISFKEIVNSSEEFEVIGAFLNCEEALSYCKNVSPDIILIDIKLPGINGIEGVKRFYYQNPKAKSMVISVYEDSDYIFEALSAGAIGYLTKNTSPEELINALRQVKNGGSPMSGNIARKVVSYFQVPKQEELTVRENEVVKLLSKGKSYATIAEELCLSVNTIKTHTRNIYEKLHVSKKEELIRKLNKFK